MTVAAGRNLGPATGGVEAGTASFLVRLRSETRLLHASAEKHIAPAENLRDLRDYARLLQALLPLYVSVEALLVPFPEWSELDPPLDVRDRARAHLVRADLDAIGIESSSALGRALGHATRPPNLAVFEHALGALYVIEGSRLGGAVLARQVSAGIGEAVDGCLRFFRSDGRDVGLLWNEFRSALSSYSARCDDRARDAIVTGALETFRYFDRQLALWKP